MDTRTVAWVAKVHVGTLNSWIQRGLVAGVSIGVQGRQREIGLDAAIEIGLLCELVRLGFSSTTASTLARVYAERRPKRLLLSPQGMVSNSPRDPMTVLIEFEDESQLPGVLRHPHPSYIVLNVEQIVRMMQTAEERWRRDHPGDGQRSAAADKEAPTVGAEA